MLSQRRSQRCGNVLNHCNVVATSLTMLPNIVLGRLLVMSPHIDGSCFLVQRLPSADGNLSGIIAGWAGFDF